MSISILKKSWIQRKSNLLNGLYILHNAIELLSILFVYDDNMIRRFYFRYDRKLIYDTDDFIEFLDIAVKIRESNIYDIVIQIIENSLIFIFVVKNSYTNFDVIRTM